MLTILGKPAGRESGSCQRIHRRSFLTIGGMALGGLSLPQAASADATSGRGRSHKAIINIYMPGGPSHIDLWDPKPQAPAEFRGEFLQADAPRQSQPKETTLLERCLARDCSSLQS